MSFHPKRAAYALLRALAPKLRPLHRLFWHIQPAMVKSPLVSAVWSGVFERKRLRLPQVSPTSDLGLGSDSVIVPGVKDVSREEDAYLEDLVFLLQFAKSLGAKRVIEIGTYRAKTTYALHLNLPEAFVRSYDIRLIPSEYRARLEAAPNVDLQIASFASCADELRREESFDFIFIDGSHRFNDVFADSELSLDILAANGVIVWHDYRKSGFVSPNLQVPEVLDLLSRRIEICGVEGTNCAVFRRGSAAASAGEK